jgi:hypothetical protein
MMSIVVRRNLPFLGVTFVQKLRREYPEGPYLESDRFNINEYTPIVEGQIYKEINSRVQPFDPRLILVTRD